MLFNTDFVLYASPGFSQNLATARAAHAMSGRATVAAHMSAPPAFRYGNFNVSLFSSGVCGSSASARVDTPVYYLGSPMFFNVNVLSSSVANFSIVA